MRALALLGLVALAGCGRLLGGVPDVDYDAVIVPVVTECYKPTLTPQQNTAYATSVMEIGFAKVRAACEAFFVDATRFQQNALATNNTLDAGLAGATSIITVTNSAAAAVKAIAITTAGVTLGKALVNEYVTIYSFGTHIQKVRQLVTADMDQFTNKARTQAPPANACRAYSLVQELALKCTLAALKDIENQQMSIPSRPKPPTDAIVTSGPNVKTISMPRSTPSVGTTIVPDF